MSVWRELWWAALGRIKRRAALWRLWCELVAGHDDQYVYGFYQCRRCWSNAPIGPDVRGWLP